jgi:ribose transport system permease protein
VRTFRQLIPLLAAVLALQLIFRFGLPYIWWDGQALLHWWTGISGFWEQGNQIDIVQQISINAILAFGMTLTILIGGIDLSVGAVLALVGTITVSILSGGKAANSGTLAVGLLAGLGAAGVLGLFNGLCAAKTKMPAFIITLATMLIARGAALRFNEGRPMHVPDQETIFLQLGNGRLGGVIPVPVIIMLAIFVLAALLLHRTRFGQHLYAMGGNREAARFTGIPLVRVEVVVYMICSLLAGVAGLINTSQLYSAEPASGVGFELNAIAAAVVGGTSFTGGKGMMVGTLIGAVIIGILDKGLNQAGVHFSLQYVVKGLVILGAVYVDVRRRK